MKRYRLFVFVTVVCLVWIIGRSRQPVADVAATGPVTLGSSDQSASSNAPGSSADGVRPLTISDVISRAEQIRSAITERLDDYTATFVKQERDDEGVLGEETVMDIKIQTRVRGPENDAPMRVFLHFKQPDASRGRKVIWGRDLYDGQMAVHEQAMLLNLKTIWLDPQGMLAMQGQRHPVWHIGILELVEQLIERGHQNEKVDGVQVHHIEDHLFDGRSCELYQISRPHPDPTDEDDFKLAEIVLDPERELVLAYRSFGWPENPNDPPPLLESYAYKNVQTNVGLTKTDFDVKNPQYGYPAF